LTVHAPNGEPLAWFGVFGAMGHDVGLPRASEPGAYLLSAWTPAMNRHEYRSAFEQIRSHIANGDTYQVNLTFPLSSAFHGDADALYGDLLVTQRPAYGSHIWHGDRHILSTSPERFFAIDGARIVTAPMKGTARRGRWRGEDDELCQHLESSAKDRAENLMIVDLIRNDLGRVCEFGSVEVEELFAVERYPTVWQMTSTVGAELRPDVALIDVFRALFPCGSVTGAPKASSMGIIHDVEGGPRGVYCGAVGFIPPGDGRSGASFNVAIRTVVVDESDGIASYGVGGGITWYSEHNDEYREAVTKTLALRGHAPITGLFETIRWDPTDGWVLRAQHLDRLEESAVYFGFSVDRGEVMVALERAVASRSAPSRVRLTVSAERVDVSVADAPVSFAMEPGPVSEAVRLGVDLDPVDVTDPSLFHKTTNRARYDQRLSRHPEADDVALVNDQGCVTETTIANIAVRQNGQWYTPPVSDGLLGGVLRNTLVANGLLVERSIPLADLSAAEAVAVLNSVRGWRPAVLEPL
jgi:para-aminobenzoate synthetase/4-amino-4-deoxychorismate lyase